MKFMISCDEATAICDKNQYGEATLTEKISLSFICLSVNTVSSIPNKTT